VKPGVPFGTTNAVWRTFAPLRSVTAKTMMKSACGPFVIQFFAPLRTHPSDVFSPDVTIVCASEPLIGSVRPKHPSVLPAAVGARISFFCASVPNL
jgi:hypothetical protein